MLYDVSKLIYKFCITRSDQIFVYKLDLLYSFTLVFFLSLCFTLFLVSFCFFVFVLFFFFFFFFFFLFFFLFIYFLIFFTLYKPFARKPITFRHIAKTPNRLCKPTQNFDTLQERTTNFSSNFEISKNVTLEK